MTSSARAGTSRRALSRVATRSRITRPAIHYYFPSKRVLWKEVVERTNAMVVDAGRSRAQAESNLMGRLSAFFAVAMQVDSDDRSVAAFLVTSALELRRHPELADDGHDWLKASRDFVSGALTDAIARGELTTDADVHELVEMLVAVLWRMVFYASVVGAKEELESALRGFELLMATKVQTQSDLTST